VLIDKSIVRMVTMDSADLERSYSREQQGLGPGHEAITSPVALVRSFTSKSQKSSRSWQSSRNHSTHAHSQCDVGASFH
jgi:hypothetical protein